MVLQNIDHDDDDSNRISFVHLLCLTSFAFRIIIKSSKIVLTLDLMLKFVL